MSNKMLIDASHPEETRVVVVRGNRIEEFDFESEHKKQLKGNIYLARVTRVEPALQAAFVEYGGNRHGFLAFTEIHPDYYQIPVADRAALLEAEALAVSEEEEDDERQAGERQERSGRRRRRGRGAQRESRHSSGAGHLADEEGSQSEAMAASMASDSISEEPGEASGSDIDSLSPHSNADMFLGDAPPMADGPSSSNGEEEDDIGHDDDNGHSEREEIESVGAEDALEEVPTRQRVQRRQYKIQEVVKRRQIMLVQVVKEERGNKGAALTTYLSLAGRYSVLMPNTGRGGGISRKITSPQDRKRLKDIVKDLAVPQGMGVILRTAGANRTKAEVKRDYEYLMRLWENVRNLTLESTAPTLVYEEGSLIKRSIRDLYNKDISEILVSGEDGYREAKDFMRMLMPSHAKVVQPYREPVPIFARNGIEAQLDRMLQPQVTLKSGGYIIINQTEALVAIDVNSGRSTREHSIEDTALQTNLEAAEEVARQLRLRDLAGLIVIDFIDMEEKRNNRSVEKKLKDCLKNDRARIQVGRISHFGLLEMSRQRIRASVLESTMQVCAVCGGTGHVRSPSSVALHVIRAIEEYLQRHSGNDIIVRTPTETALYVLNHKRQNLADLEARFGLTITIEADDSVGSQHLAIEKGAPAAGPVQSLSQIHPGFGDETEEEEVPAEAEPDAEEEESASERQDERQGEQRGRKRRRRSKRRKDRESPYVGGEARAGGDEGDEAEETEDAGASTASDHNEAAGEQQRKKRRRGRRGGRKNRRDGEGSGMDQPAAEASYSALPEGQADGIADGPVIQPNEDENARVSAEPPMIGTSEAPAEEAAGQPATEAEPVAKVRPTRSRSRKPRPEKGASTDVTVAEAAPGTVTAAETVVAPEAAPQEEAPAPQEAAESGKPQRAGRRASRHRTEVEDEPASEPVVTSASQEGANAGETPERKRSGWWQKKGFF